MITIIKKVNEYDFSNKTTGDTIDELAKDTSNYIAFDICNNILYGSYDLKLGTGGKIPWRLLGNHTKTSLLVCPPNKKIILEEEHTLKMDNIIEIVSHDKSLFQQITMSRPGETVQKMMHYLIEKNITDMFLHIKDHKWLKDGYYHIPTDIGFVIPYKVLGDKKNLRIILSRNNNTNTNIITYHKLWHLDTEASEIILSDRIRECCVCLEVKSVYVRTFPCDHIGLCRDCYSYLIKQSPLYCPTCPRCNIPIYSTVTNYYISLRKKEFVTLE